MIKLKQIRNPN